MTARMARSFASGATGSSLASVQFAAMPIFAEDVGARATHWRTAQRSVHGAVGWGTSQLCASRTRCVVAARKPATGPKTAVCLAAIVAMAVTRGGRAQGSGTTRAAPGADGSPGDLHPHLFDVHGAASTHAPRKRTNGVPQL